MIQFPVPCRPDSEKSWFSNLPHIVISDRLLMDRLLIGHETEQAKTHPFGRAGRERDHTLLHLMSNASPIPEMKRSISGDDALVACEWSTLYKFLSEEFSPPSSPRSQPLPIRCSSSGTVDTELSPDQDVMAAAVAMVPAELHDGSAPSERRSSGDDTALIACEWSNLYRFLSEFSPPSSPRSGTTDSPSSASKASVLLNALSKHTGHAAFPHKKWASKLSLLLTRFRRNEQRTAQPAGSADSIRTGCFPKLWSSPAPEVYIPTEEDRITEENTTANLANLIPISHSTREREPEEPSLGTLQRTTSAPIATLCDSGKKSSLKRIVSDAETLGGGGGIPRMSPKPPLSLTFGDVTYNVDRPAAVSVLDPAASSICLRPPNTVKFSLVGDTESEHGLSKGTC